MICAFIGYIFLIVPENLYSECKKYFCPELHEPAENNSLTRRYKSTQPPSPSPTLNQPKMNTNNAIRSSNLSITKSTG